MEKRSTVIEESSRDKTLLNNWPLCLWDSRRETKDAVTSVVRPSQKPEVGSCQSNLVPLQRTAQGALNLGKVHIKLMA